jgi:hypothetical protein
MDQFNAARVGDVDQLRRVLTVDNVDDVDGVNWTALVRAAKNGQVECVKVCLEMGANVNARDDVGATPLRFASSNGQMGAVRILLDAGATVDAKSNNGWTPLYFAIRCNRVDIARLLIDRGANVSNVKLNDSLKVIPDWVNTFVASRSNCRCVAVILIGIHKYHQTHMTGNNDINVLRLIGKHIWSTRMDDAWS